MSNNHDNGNVAAMREALELCYRIIHCAIVTGVINLGDANKAMEAYHSALAAPQRNCDIGTAEEQAERFIDYCCDKCDGVKCKHGLYREDEIYKCVIKWTQMLYCREDDNAQK